MLQRRSTCSPARPAFLQVFDAVGGTLTLTTTDGRDIVATETLGGAGTGGIDDAVAAAGGITTSGQISLTATEKHHDDRCIC